MTISHIIDQHVFLLQVESTCPTHPPLPPLRHFSIDKVLFEDPKAKSIAVAGTFSSLTDTAIIIAEKSPLSQASLSQLFSAESKISTNFHNNIYSQIEASCGGSVGDLRLMTVYPATDAHLSKYSQQTIHLIHESPEDYATITRPFIDGQSFDIQVGYIKQFLDSILSRSTVSVLVASNCAFATTVQLIIIQNNLK